MLLEAHRAVVIGACADERTARLKQVPATHDVGEILFFVLGQQDKAKRIGAVLELRQDAPACLLQAQVFGSEGLLGVGVLERTEFGAQEERALPRQRA
jgi:hypothetical protein